MVSRDGSGGPVPRQLAHLHTQAETGAYLRNFSRVPRRRPFIYFQPPYAIASAPSLSGHAIAYRWRSLLRVRRHKASKPQGSSERVLPWKVTMDQITCACLSHTHDWYEVGMYVESTGYHALTTLYPSRHALIITKHLSYNAPSPGCCPQLPTGHRPQVTAGLLANSKCLP